MRRTLTLLLLLLTSAAGADDTAPAVPGEPERAEAAPVLGDKYALAMPPDRDRLDWEWLGDFAHGEDGELLLLGSGLSYATSPAFAVGGSYAMAMPYADTPRPRDVDPARYTIYMRWRF